MKKELGIDMKVSKGDKCDYIRTQIFNYSTSMAIDRINEHTQFNLDDETKSCFNGNIDLYYLFKVVRENIDNNNKANIDEILEVIDNRITGKSIYTIIEEYRVKPFTNMMADLRVMRETK